MANIREVAKRAGVSIATVSHVFNKTRPVSDEVRARVTQAAADLHYYPNYLARSLTTKKTGTIGMVVSDMSNPFFAELIHGVEKTLSAHQYNLMICNTEDNPYQEEEYLRLLMAKRVDGIVAAVASEKWAALQAAEARSFPLVFIDLRVEGVRGPLVCAANEEGAYQGIAHLIADGHRAIGILAGMPNMSTMRDRLAGYRRALAEHELPSEERLVKFSRLEVDAATQQMKALLAESPRPSAVFLNNNLLALGALIALQQIGLTCPEDVALACFDDAPWMCVADPPLTVLRQPTYEMGTLAGHLLLQQLRGEPVPRTAITLQPELIVRQSCRADRHRASLASADKEVMVQTDSDHDTGPDAHESQSRAVHALDWPGGHYPVLGLAALRTVRPTRRVGLNIMRRRALLGVH
jgi:LacI family transcriptional regulator